MKRLVRMCRVQLLSGTWKNRSGTTLTELITTFALMGLFLVSASLVLTRGLQLFSRMQAASKAVSVSDLILDKITGEISAADVPAKGETAGYYFWLDPEGRWAAFRNRSGSPVVIFADYETEEGETTVGGQLIIRFYGITGASAAGSGRTVSGIDWKYDKNVYMGYQITELLFRRPQPETHPNVFRIDLTLYHPGYGHAYHTYRYAENYNYDGSDKLCEHGSGGLAGLPTEAIEFAFPAQ